MFTSGRSTSANRESPSDNAIRPYHPSKKKPRAQADLSLEKVFSLLGAQHIKGSDKELKMLCLRIGELVELNGEDWVKESRQSLLDEWEYIVAQGIIT